MIKPHKPSGSSWPPSPLCFSWPPILLCFLVVIGLGLVEQEIDAQSGREKKSLHSIIVLILQGTQIWCVFPFSHTLGVLIKSWRPCGTCWYRLGSWSHSCPRPWNSGKRVIPSRFSFERWLLKDLTVLSPVVTCHRSRPWTNYNSQRERKRRVPLYSSHCTLWR